MPLYFRLTYSCHILWTNHCLGVLGGVDKPGRGGTGLKYRLIVIAATSRGCTVEEDATKLLPAFYFQPPTLLCLAWLNSV